MIIQSSVNIINKVAISTRAGWRMTSVSQQFLRSFFFNPLALKVRDLNLGLPHPRQVPNQSAIVCPLRFLCLPAPPSADLKTFLKKISWKQLYFCEMFQLQWKSKNVSTSYKAYLVYPWLPKHDAYHFRTPSVSEKHTNILLSLTLIYFYWVTTEFMIAYLRVQLYNMLKLLSITWPA